MFIININKNLINLTLINNFSEEVRVSVPTKNLKLVAFPGVNYNDKYIIEEVSLIK